MMMRYALLSIIVIGAYLINISCKPKTSTDPVSPETKVIVNFDAKALECLGNATPEEMKINVDGGDITGTPTPIDSKKWYGTDIVNGGSYPITIPTGAHGITVKITYAQGSCVDCCKDKCSNTKGGSPVLRGTAVYQTGSVTENVTVSLQSCRDCCM